MICEGSSENSPKGLPRFSSYPLLILLSVSSWVKYHVLQANPLTPRKLRSSARDGRQLGRDWVAEALWGLRKWDGMSGAFAHLRTCVQASEPPESRVSGFGRCAASRIELRRVCDTLGIARWCAARAFQKKRAEKCGWKVCREKIARYRQGPCCLTEKSKVLGTMVQS